ncbi:MAG: hypothetical protein LUF33_02345 [Clostridiales bacterium]|nr:hypothetical protein [Clostridiales bacterium]
MKKFIIAVVCIVLAVLLYDAAYYRFGFYIDFNPDEEITTFMTTDEDTVYMTANGETEPFEIRGVNLGVGIPGEWATDYAIDEETYLRWFQYIKDLGANTIRVYTILQDDFYNAFYEFNKDNDDPLYLIHGVWINDYTQNSHYDAYDDEFMQTFIDDCRTVIDIIHGNKKLSLGYGTGSGTYNHDISQWVIGYILGVEWEDVTVLYTDEKYPDRNSYEGEYMYTTEDATPFEAMLAEVGNKTIEYETDKYKQQRLIAFSNWPTTDPFEYPEYLEEYFMKCAQVDVEHIKTTDSFISGQFASYHVYPYYPDYLEYVDDWTDLGITDSSEFINEDGELNTYRAYLSMLTEHHSMPVVISEYGVSTGRGMAQVDKNTGRNQGNMSEQEQGEALVECYEDIMSVGCAGSISFTWQDEWFKRTWNTMHAVDLDNTAYWSDYQTNEQYFGLLAFDPGEEESVCYVDGDISEWSESDKVVDNGDMSVSMKYDEKYIYFLIYKKDFDSDNDILYIPIDTTQKTGSTYCSNYDIKFDRECDFVISIDGKNNSRVQVQERYNVLRAMYFHDTDNSDAYVNEVDKNTNVFSDINLILQTSRTLELGLQNLYGNDENDYVSGITDVAETYETGILEYGNANPESDDYTSLADFIFNGDYIEIKLPWQLLNFSNPSEMMIHDDYYECYGVENIQIDEMYIGIGSEETKTPRIMLESFALEGWGKDVTYHERLKESYYILQEYWASVDAESAG